MKNINRYLCGTIGVAFGIIIVILIGNKNDWPVAERIIQCVIYFLAILICGWNLPLRRIHFQKIPDNEFRLQFCLEIMSLIFFWGTIGWFGDSYFIKISADVFLLGTMYLLSRSFKRSIEKHED